MDTLSYVFIDSVAHITPRDNAASLCQFSNDVWFAIGQTHKEKRFDLDFSVRVRNMNMAYGYPKNRFLMKVSAVLTAGP
ncbi:hypothetical protein L596_009371 [Steinernema carpocapsae]|uniref:Uncharacterized protein n=1 Tax=Steinernema carpocapsae TaxID=34508 RepID=A0A4U5PFC4_STECR|nr:hypothetical protein L596_009371 [Steinernema carpocapsae]